VDKRIFQKALGVAVHEIEVNRMPTFEIDWVFISLDEDALIFWSHYKYNTILSGKIT